MVVVAGGGVGCGRGGINFVVVIFVVVSGQVGPSTKIWKPLSKTLLTTLPRMRIF